MNAAITNGRLRIDEKITVSGQSPPISRLLTIIVMTWLGTINAVQIQSLLRER